MPLPHTGVALVANDGQSPVPPGFLGQTFGGIPLDRLVAAQRASILIVGPRCLESGHNLASIVGWHRARGGGVTLVTAPQGWTGIAVVDRALLQDRHLDSGSWNPAGLLALSGGRARAVSFPGHRSPTTILLDRDGTIIVDQDYLADPRDVTLLPGAATGLFLLAARGVTLVVITNQSGIGRGRLTWAQVQAVNARLRDRLAADGVSLDGIYVCPHREDEGCDCRKPGDRLARQAAQELGLSLDQAVVVGDKPADIGLARRLGVPGFLVTTGYGAVTLEQGDVPADYVVDGLDDLAGICGDPAGLAVAADLPAA
jgi:D-glycero-D-manno-heptose 1,7-bisphosphate phosphatase